MKDAHMQHCNATDGIGPREVTYTQACEYNFILRWHAHTNVVEVAAHFFYKNTTPSSYLEPKG